MMLKCEAERHEGRNTDNLRLMGEEEKDDN